MSRTLTVYKFIPEQSSETIEEMLKSRLEVTQVAVVARDIVSFFIMEFDEYDNLTDEEIAFLQETFHGYYLVENGIAIEIYNGAKGEYIKTAPTLLSEMRERYYKRKDE